ncbi:MAG TPA: hypothetical protein VJ600_02565 [Holophagaceae bacterium]|nr:hypothetical protein [Holophagaceae bacterium]
MASINLEGVLETLSPEVRRALASAVRELHPGLTVDEGALFRAFKRSLLRLCDDWADVPSHYLDM